MTRTMSHPRTPGRSLCQSLGLVVRNVVFTLVVPGLGGAWLPWWLLTHGHATPTPTAWEAIPVIAAGAALYFWCAWNFAAVGGGTPGPWDAPGRVVARGPYRDRKSTRLNSSHSQISYAVFCLKKKKKKSSRQL